MSLEVLVLTLNCGRVEVDPVLLASNVNDILHDDPPDLIFLSLQEIAPISYAFIGGSALTSYLDAYRATIDRVADGQYVEVASSNVGMTASMLFAKPDIAKHLHNISTAGVGVGVLQMGNKGAVGIRTTYATDSSVACMTFVGAHFAPHEFGSPRRNKDWENIVRRLVFVPDGESPKIDSQMTEEEEEDTETDALIPKSEIKGLYAPKTHIIVAGDLNYRTSSRAPTAEDQLLYPRPVSDRDSKVHFSKLLKSDQLTAERTAGRTLHGLDEANIDFEPTYKYAMSGSRPDGTGIAKTSAKIQHEPLQNSDQGTEEWNWAPWRWPSWCDRILYTPLPAWYPTKSTLKPKLYTSLPLLPTTDHKPVALLLSIPTAPFSDPSISTRAMSTDPRIHPPFSIDSAWRLNRATARNLEFLVGVVAWLTTTTGGRTVLMSVVIGGLGSMWLSQKLR